MILAIVLGLNGATSETSISEPDSDILILLPRLSRGDPFIGDALLEEEVDLRESFKGELVRDEDGDDDICGC